MNFLYTNFLVFPVLLSSVDSPFYETDCTVSEFTTAAGMGDIYKVLYCLEHGSDIEESDNEFTPLMLASRYGHEDIVALLVNYGANIEAEVPFTGARPLMFAAENGHVEVVSRLLAQGADYKAHAFSGENAIVLAHINHHEAIKSLLLDAGEIFIGYYGLTPIFERFVPYLKKNLPDLYDAELYKYLSYGLCAGYAHLSLMLSMAGQYQQFHDELIGISRWDSNLAIFKTDTELKNMLAFHTYHLNKMQQITNQLYTRVFIEYLPYHYDLQKPILYNTLFQSGFLFEAPELAKYLELMFNYSNYLSVTGRRSKSYGWHAIGIESLGEERFKIYNFDYASGSIIVTGIENLCKHMFGVYEPRDKTIKRIGLMLDLMGNQTLPESAKSALNNHLIDLVHKRKNTLNYLDEYDCTAFCYALGNQLVYKSLLQNGLNINLLSLSRVNIVTIISHSVYFAEIVDDLIRAGWRDAYAVLNYAVDNNLLPITELLLKAGVKIIPGYLATAIHKCNLEMVKLLHRYGANLSPATGLYIARRTECFDISDYILEHVNTPVDVCFVNNGYALFREVPDLQCSSANNDSLHIK